MKQRENQVCIGALARAPEKIMLAPLAFLRAHCTKTTSDSKCSRMPTFYLNFQFSMKSFLIIVFITFCCFSNRFPKKNPGINKKCTKPVNYREFQMSSVCKLLRRDSRQQNDLHLNDLFSFSFHLHFIFNHRPDIISKNNTKNPSQPVWPITALLLNLIELKLSSEFRIQIIAANPCRHQSTFVKQSRV